MTGVGNSVPSKLRKSEIVSAICPLEKPPDNSMSPDA